MFRWRMIVNRELRITSFFLRFFGIDFTLAAFFDYRDWRIIDLRIPADNALGIYLQVLFLFVGISRLKDDAVYRGLS